MTKFNSSSRGATKTVNSAGGVGYTKTAKTELVQLLACSFLEPQYYSTVSGQANRIMQLASQITDHKFLAKAALFTRHNFGMRSSSHLLASEIARLVKGERWTKNFFDNIVARPDDITEILSAYFKGHDRKGRGVPKAMRVGFGKAFNRFDGYQLAKWSQDDKQLSLKDVVKMIHANGDLIDALMKDALEIPETHEVLLSQAGKDATTDDEKRIAKIKAWTYLLDNQKVGYLALTMNVRNILTLNDENLTSLLCQRLVDHKGIKKVFPFQIYRSYLANKNCNNSQVIAALSDALDKATENVPEFSGKTLIAVDHSGSMGIPAGGSKNITCKIAGDIIAATLVRKSNADVMVFGDSAKYIPVNPRDSVISIAREIGSKCYGYGTNISAIFEQATKKYDRIIIISDMQTWIDGYGANHGLKGYNTRHDVHPHIFTFDLAGHSTHAFPEQRVHCVAGFVGDSIFDIIARLEENPQAMVDTIESMEL